MKHTHIRKNNEPGFAILKTINSRFESWGNFQIRRYAYALKRLPSGETILHVPPSIIARPSSILEVVTTLREPSTTSTSLKRSSKSVDNQIRRQAAYVVLFLHTFLLLSWKLNIENSQQIFNIAQGSALSVYDGHKIELCSCRREQYMYFGGLTLRSRAEFCIELEKTY